MSLSEALESAFQGQDTQAETPAEQAPAVETPQAGETQGEASVQAIGFTPEQPQGEQTQQEWALQLEPDTVVAHDEAGRPITAKEVQQGYLRQADYTRKTQEIAEARQWVSENRDFLTAMQSGDPEAMRPYLEAIAREAGIQFGQPDGRARDEQGRFTAKEAAPSDAPTVNPDDFIPGTPEHAMAVQLAALQSQLGQVQSRYEQEQEAIRYQQEANSIAQQWQTAGLTDVDIQGARSLVGKPMSVDQAMILHHFEKILAHNHRAATSQAPRAMPQEPTRYDSRSGPGSYKGVSLTEALR